MQIMKNQGDVLMKERKCLNPFLLAWRLAGGGGTVLFALLVHRYFFVRPQEANPTVFVCVGKIGSFYRVR